MKKLTVAFLFLISFLCLFNKGIYAATVDVEVRDSFFQPQNVTINVEDTVRWTNSGVLFHTTTSGTDGNTVDGIWDSGTMSTGMTFSLTFDQSGTFPYHCTFHWFSGMKGTIVVNPPTGTVPVPSAQQAFPLFSPIVLPLPSTDPAMSQPIGVGTIATGGDSLSIVIDTGQFSAFVDVYFAISAPAITPDIFLLTSDNVLQSSSLGLVPWKTGVMNVNEAPFSINIPISILPSATYMLFLAVTPAGSIGSFYLWTTNFIVS